MGLHSQLNDVSSESIPILMIVLIASCIGYLRSVLSGFLHSMGHTRLDPNNDHINHNRIVDGDFFLGSMGSGHPGLIVLAEQLSLNRLLSFQYSEQHGHGGCVSDCVVCLCTLKDGDQIRLLDCRHVFHKVCFDSWLDHHNFNCPLCRSTLVDHQRVPFTHQRFGAGIISWFSLR